MGEADLSAAGPPMALPLGTLGWAQWVHDLDAAKTQAILDFWAVAPADINANATN